MTLIGVHRDTDFRICGARTEATNHGVTANSLLIAILGDSCNHDDGALQASANKVTAGGKCVVLNKPDLAAPDGLCPLLNALHCAPVTDGGSDNVKIGIGGCA